MEIQKEEIQKKIVNSINRWYTWAENYYGFEILFNLRQAVNSAITNRLRESEYHSDFKELGLNKLVYELLYEFDAIDKESIGSEESND